VTIQQSTYTAQIADTLILYHKNVIHGDLKTGNILLGTNGALKIADFGHSAMILLYGMYTIFLLL